MLSDLGEHATIHSRRYWNFDCFVFARLAELNPPADFICHGQAFAHQSQ